MSARPIERRSASRLHRHAAVALGLLAAAAAWAQPGARPAPTPQPGALSPSAGRCGVCHPAERVKFDASQHAHEGVRCTSCHGGDDRSLTIELAHGGNFRGRTARKDIPALCASCHSDEKMMRAYNLPVDQYAVYQTSVHGQRLKRGDTAVAVCSDCHGAHDILGPGDPASRTFAPNIPATCGACHGDTTLMRRRGVKDAYREYLSSIHARELLDRGNLRAPTCVSCHGVHGAAPPAVGDVDKVCGQCHTAERRYFAASAHIEGMRRAGLPECSSCHGDHAIQAAQPERLATSCAQCHAADSDQAALGAKLWTEYRAAAAEIEKADSLITRADAIPIQTDDYRARIEQARTYLREALPAAHSVDPVIVGGFTLRARSVGSEVESEIYGKLGNLRTRKFVLILFWFYVLVTLAILRRLRYRTAKAH